MHSFSSLHTFSSRKQRIAQAVGALSLAALCAGVSCQAQAAPPALVAAAPASGFPNGDMSLGDAVPTGWSAGWTGSGKIELQRDTKVFHSAPASLLVQSVGGPAVGGANHGFDVTHAPFTISAYLKTAGNLKTALLAIQVFDGSGKQIDWITIASVSGANDWQKFSTTATLPANAAAAQLVLTLSGDGQEWLDDVTSTAQAAQSPPPPVADAAALPVAILPMNPRVRYVGRYDDADPAGPRCAWPAGSVTLKFRGTALNAALADTNNDRWQVEIDGRPAQTLQMRDGHHVYQVASGLAPGVHTVRLVKATESFFGTAQFLGFQLSRGGSLLAVPIPPHRLEVIGDSISCGYGDEAASQNERFSPKTENAYFSYGATAARDLNADYMCIAWSGKTMWPKNTIPELYDRTLPTDADSRWDFARWTPDVILINLATNDFAGKTFPDQAGWTGGYSAFITRLRTHFPHAQIYCAIGPMLSGKALSTVQDYLTTMVASINAAGDTKVHLLEFATQDGRNGFGADWHPNVKTHKIMAEKLDATLQTDLGWSEK